MGSLVISGSSPSPAATPELRWVGGSKRNNGAADLKGLKMRIPGMGGKVMSCLGANVQVIAGGDLSSA